MKKVAIIGLGVMGFTAAGRVLAAGHAVSGFDPSDKACERATATGVRVAASAAEAAREADVVLLFLPGPDQIIGCLTGGVFAALAPGAVIVDHSTVDPDTSRKMAGEAVKAHLRYVDAPVLGRPGAVGKWALPIGETPGALDSCREVLNAYAGAIIPVGGPGSGNIIKLLNQLMFGAINAMTAEMMAIADGLGVAPARLFEIITASQAGTVSNLFKELGSRIAADDFESPTFSVDLLIKDVHLAVDMARNNGTPPILGRTVEYLNEMARAQGCGAKDTAVMWKCVKRSWQG